MFFSALFGKTLDFILSIQVIPVQSELLQVGEVTGDVLQGRVSDPRAPAEVQADQLPEVLRNQLNAIIRDLAAAREREDGQVGQRVNWG